MSEATAPRGRYRVTFVGGPWDGKEVRLAGTTDGPGLPDELHVRSFFHGEELKSQSLTMTPCTCSDCQNRRPQGHNARYVKIRAQKGGFVFQLEGLNL